MCNACGESGAILAYARAALRPSSASGRIIDAVNDVVRHARMVLMARQHLVENLAALLLPRIRLVGRVEVADRHQLQGVENRRLVVVGIPLADPGQSPLVILRPGGVVHRLPVLVEHRERIDVVALAIGLRASGQRAIESRRALLQFLGRRRRPYRVIPGPRDAPVRHGAGRVGLRGIVERDSRFLVAERMQQSRCAGDQLLRRGVAGGRKVHRAETGNGVLVLRVIFLGKRESSAQN